MKKLGKFMFALFAICALGIFASCSSGDDSNSTGKKTTGTETVSGKENENGSGSGNSSVTENGSGSAAESGSGSSGESEIGNGDLVAEFEITGSDEKVGGSVNLKFYDDKTGLMAYDIHTKFLDGTEIDTVINVKASIKFSYTGDVTKNGTVKITFVGKPSVQVSPKKYQEHFESEFADFEKGYGETRFTVIEDGKKLKRVVGHDEEDEYYTKK